MTLTQKESEQQRDTDSEGKWTTLWQWLGRKLNNSDTDSEGEWTHSVTLTQRESEQECDINLERKWILASLSLRSEQQQDRRLTLVWQICSSFQVSEKDGRAARMQFSAISWQSWNQIHFYGNTAWIHSPTPPHPKNHWELITKLGLRKLSPAFPRGK